MRRILSSESVNIGHPDKTCDYIADSFLDAALTEDPDSMMAVECAIKDDLLMIYGEATTKAKLDYQEIAKKALKEIGYENRFRFVQQVSEQSPDINQAVVKGETMANDQGMMYGFACDETKELMPMPIVVAHKLMKKYDEFRRKNSRKYFADAKSQVSIAYENGVPVSVHTVLVSVSHCKDLEHDEIYKDIFENVVKPVLDENGLKYDEARFVINPSGRFVVWGSFSDSGCVGRKIVVDTYGGIGRVGGGCFSSKNSSKVDRSAAYYARYVAKNIVAHGLANKCEIQVSYAIGLADPLSLDIDCFGTNKVTQTEIEEFVANNFNFRPQNMIEELELLKPIYKETACYGHFGREEFSWEKIKKQVKL